MEVVPFSSEAYEGLADVKGLVRFENDILYLEFQTQDAFLGVVKSQMKQIQIPVRDVVLVDLEGRFRHHLILQVRRLDLVADLPKSEGGHIKLRINRRHRPAAGDLISEIKLRLSELRYNQVVEEGQSFEEGS